MRTEKLFPLLSLLLCINLNISAQNGPGCAALEGVWEYDLDTHRGLWFSQDGHYLWVMVGKERPALASGEISIEEKAAAFEQLNIAYGKLNCDEKQGTATNIYAEIPAWTGNTFRFDIEIEDGKARYWVLQKDGSRGPEGRSHKIEDIPAPSDEGCGQIAGFWTYDLPTMEGVCVFSDKHFAWILINKEFWSSNPSLNTAEEKARAFDSILAATGTYNCDGQGRYEWQRRHAKDIRAETGAFFSENEFDGNTQNYWILDGEGKRNGPGGKAVRIK